MFGPSQQVEQLPPAEMLQGNTVTVTGIRRGQTVNVNYTDGNGCTAALQQFIMSPFIYSDCNYQGTQTICPGVSANLTVILHWHCTVEHYLLQRNTPTTVTISIPSPYTLTVSPATTTTYTITNVNRQLWLFEYRFR